MNSIFNHESFKRILLVFTLLIQMFAITGLSRAETFGVTDVTLVGNAVILSNGNLQLTSAWDQAGAAWATTAISTSNSFTTTFNFLLNFAPPSTDYPSITEQADGITLAFQSAENNIVIGGGGASLGVGGIANASGSAIQTWSNNKVGFFGPGVDPAALTINSFSDFDLGNTSSLTGAETISYDAYNHLLSMTGQINGYNIADTLTIDLSSIYGSTMYLGFTGGSGLGGSDQEITSWSGINQTTAPVPEPATIFLLGSGLLGIAGFRKRSK